MVPKATRACGALVIPLAETRVGVGSALEPPDDDEAVTAAARPNATGANACDVVSVRDIRGRRDAAGRKPSNPYCDMTRTSAAAIGAGSTTAAEPPATTRATCGAACVAASARNGCVAIAGA
jgi:hypothetical protein